MRSTARLYLTAFRHAGACVGAMAFTYIVACVVLSAYVHDSSAVDRLQIDRSLEDQMKWVIDSPAVQAFFSISLFFLLVPYALFTVRRWRIRRRLHRTIAGRAFRDDLLPEKMDVKLSGASLSRLFYRGPLLAHHEDYVSSGPPTVTSISDVKRRDLPLSGPSQGYTDEESSWLASARLTYVKSMGDMKQPHRIPCPPELCPLDTDRDWSVWLTSGNGGYLIDEFMLYDYQAAISREPLIRWPLIFAGYFVWLNGGESVWLWLWVLLIFAWFL